MGVERGVSGVLVGREFEFELELAVDLPLLLEPMPPARA